MNLYSALHQSHIGIAFRLRKERRDGAHVNLIENTAMYTDQEEGDSTRAKDLDGEQTWSSFERLEVFEQLHFVLGGLWHLFCVELFVGFEIGRVAWRGDDGLNWWFDCSS